MKKRIPGFEEFINESNRNREPMPLSDNEIKELMRFGFFKDDMGYGQYAKLELDTVVGSDIIEVYLWEDGKYRINRYRFQDRTFLTKDGIWIKDNYRNWGKAGMTWNEVIKVISNEKIIK